MSDASPLAPLSQRVRHHRTTLTLVVGVPVVAAVLGAVGLPTGVSPLLGPLTVAESLLSAGVLAAAYWGAGVGLAWPIGRWLGKGSGERWWLQIALGLALMPWLSHVMGVLGLFAGESGRWAAIGVLVLGLVLLSVQLAREVLAKPLIRPADGIWLLALLPAAIMLTAACSPPGILWRSEAGGFDALSYHLPLAQEWARLGRIVPQAHNVYSYLPSYLEASFTHLSVVLGGGTTPLGRAAGLLARDGLGLSACQLLHALSALAAAGLLGRVVMRLGERGGLSRQHSAAAGAIAGSGLLALPWTTVCGSLAYNEMTVCAALAAALLAAGDDRLSPLRAGALAGLFVGAAVSFKPSSAFMVAPAAGLVLLFNLRPKAWPMACVAGTIACLVMVGPWMARNASAGGNPVFPAATGVFGMADWTAEQVARFQRGHTPDAGIGAQVVRLFSPSGDARSVDAEARGFLHGQWGLLFPCAIALGMAALAWRPARLFTACATGGLIVGCVWWVAFSHAQSRFLLPLAPLLCAMVGLGAAASLAGERDASGGMLPLKRLAFILAACVPLLQQALGLANWLSQAGWHTNQGLAFGAGLFTGEPDRFEYQRAGASQQRELERDFSPTTFVNLAIPPTETVYLLGESRPLYFTGRILYHTTWSASPLGDAVRAGGEPTAWTDALRQRGIDWVLINESELRRLWASGWYDPAVSDDAVRRWMRSLGEPARAWQTPEGSAVILYHLRPTRTGGTT